jgi:photosystem I P700 chlorophyll a apoprotein A2
LYSASLFDIDNLFTFLGGLKSNTISLYLTDIAHHHLGVGILFVWARHLYLSLYKAFGHRIRPLAKSLQLQLSLSLVGLSLITSLLAGQMYSFLMMGTFAHAGIFLIRDYRLAAHLIM